VTANFRNRISMERNEKSCHGVKVPPFFLVVSGEGGLFFSVVLVWRVDCLSTVHIPLGQWTADFPCQFGGVFKSKSSQCRPRFTYVGGPKGRITIIQNRTFYFGEPL
jgi:hypothetical protein